MEEFEFNPRDLIAGPFEACPKCRQPLFGVVTVRRDAYFRRCQTCFHSAIFTLPALRKKVLYLDQFAISNLVKALDPHTKGHERTAADPFWPKLFQALEIAAKMQLIVCPDSDEHRNESLVAPFYSSLKRIYEHFSNGVSFHDSWAIRRTQLVEMAEQWLDGKEPKCTLDPALVTTGDLHGWQSPIGVSATLPQGDEILHEIRDVRRRVHQEMQIAFEYWRSERLSFDQRFAREVGHYGEKLLASLAEWRNRLREAQVGLNSVDPRELYPPPAADVFGALIIAFRGRGLSEHEAGEKVIEFLKSDVPTASPRRQMFGLLYAALAMRAENGQAHAPNQGMATDISVIADLLPYCDAMFVDNAARALVEDIPKSRRPPYGGQIFSAKVRGKFLAYLEQLIAAAPKDRQALIRQVYGDEYAKPYTEILSV